MGMDEEGSGDLFGDLNSADEECDKSFGICKELDTINKTIEDEESKFKSETDQFDQSVIENAENIKNLCPDPSDSNWLDLLKNNETGEWLHDSYQLAVNDLDECYASGDSLFAQASSIIASTSTEHSWDKEIQEIKAIDVTPEEWRDTPAYMSR